jgi:iturin family lipopeptide synthetase A
VNLDETPTPEADDTLAGRLAKFARLTPAADAIVDGDRRVNYAKLDAVATAIALRLDGVGGARPGRACLLFRDRVAAAQSMLGVARSGHAFVPLDPDDPDARLDFMLADSAPLAILTEPDLAQRAHDHAPAGCAVVEVADIADATGAATAVRVRGDAIAQLLYTSGSTGQPKGVLQTHANQLFFVDAYARDVGIGAGDRISLLHSLRFAAGVFAVFRSVGLGATLCLYDLRRDGIAGLADWLDRERITMLHAFPAVFREMAAHLPAQRKLSQLDVVSLGGESLFASDVAMFRAHTAPHCRLVHQLAASEMAGITRNILGHDARPAPGAVISAGRAVDGVRLEIRREDGNVAPVGESGELVACSAYLSPGYWNRPDLDARAFAADAQAAGSRCYRTGDLGRLDAHGELHFLGRAGGRVKLRGYTIDLAEIEAALVAWPHATAVAAAAESDDADATAARLVAYIEPRLDAPREPDAVKRFLAGMLPPHMVPAQVRYVAALPRTAGGKLDRRRLAEAERLPAERREIRAPRDAMEAAVAHVFAELLKLDGAGPDDDFFLLGGDSLMAAELITRIDAAFGVRVGDLHHTATVAAIATRIRRGLAPAPRG